MKKLFTLIATALFAVNVSADEVTLWEGSMIADGWDNQPYALSDGGAELKGVNAKAGDELRFYITATAEGWQLQIIEGHWGDRYGYYAGSALTDENTSEPLGNEVVDLSTVDYVTLTLTDEILTAAYTTGGWGGVFVLNGDGGIECTKITYIKIGEDEENTGNGKDVVDLTPFLVKDANTEGGLAEPRVVEDPADNANHCINVAVAANAENEWAAQLFISAPEAFKEGDVITLKMRVKAEKEQSGAAAQLHSTPGSYQHWQATGDADFTTAWSQYNGSYTIAAEAEGAQVIAFNLSVVGGEANNLYFDDIVLVVNGEDVVNEDFEEGTSGIANVVVSKPMNNSVYNLAGQKVDESYKGIVIMNGKKFIQK